MFKYSRFRFFLMTLAFGLACANFSDFLTEKPSEKLVNLPQVESKTPFVIHPVQSVVEVLVCKGHVCTISESGR